jgi:hypothetical protein
MLVMAYSSYCKSRERCNVAHRIIVENLLLVRVFDEMKWLLDKAPVLTALL